MLAFARLIDLMHRPAEMSGFCLWSRAMRCTQCKGSGEQDSGGFSTQGHPVGNGQPCPTCEGTGDDGHCVDRIKIMRQITSLQNSRDYADEVEAQHLTRRIDRLLDVLEWDELCI